MTHHQQSISRKYAFRMSHDFENDPSNVNFKSFSSRETSIFLKVQVRLRVPSSTQINTSLIFITQSNDSTIEFLTICIGATHYSDFCWNIIWASLKITRYYFIICIFISIFFGILWNFWGMNMNADSDFSHVQTRLTANSCVILVYFGS